MKITTITCEHTRQVTQFNPVRFAISADLTEKDDPEKCAKDLQRLVLMITYKDDPKQRDHLINSLCPKEDAKQPEPVKAEIKKPTATAETEAKKKISEGKALQEKTKKSSITTEEEEMPNF